MSIGSVPDTAGSFVGPSRAPTFSLTPGNRWADRFRLVGLLVRRHWRATGPRYRCDGACRPKNAKQESLDHDEKQMAVDHSRGGRGRNGLGRVCALHAFSAPAKPPLVGLTPLVSGAPSSSRHEKTPGAEDARGRSDRLAGQEGGPTKFSLRFIRYNRAKPRCNRTPVALPEFCCCFFAAPDGRRVAPSAWPEAELRRLMRR